MGVEPQRIEEVREATSSAFVIKVTAIINGMAASNRRMRKVFIGP
jgi:hypothetical protein